MKIVYGLEQPDFRRDSKRNSRVRTLTPGERLTVGRLEGFFKVLPKTPEEIAKQKRKADDAAAERKVAKKGKAGGAPGRKGGK